MAITETIRGPLNVVRMAVVSHIDTGSVAARKFKTGFRPRYVLAMNETDGDKMEWFEGMADAEAIKTTDTGAAAIITTLGITPAADGFTLGIDTDVYVASEQLSILVLG